MIDLLKQYEDRFILVPENLDFTLLLHSNVQQKHVSVSLSVAVAAENDTFSNDTFFGLIPNSATITKDILAGVILFLLGRA